MFGFNSHVAPSAETSPPQERQRDLAAALQNRQTVLSDGRMRDATAKANHIFGAVTGGGTALEGLPNAANLQGQTDRPLSNPARKPLHPLCSVDRKPVGADLAGFI